MVIKYSLWVYFPLLLLDGSSQFLDSGRGFWTRSRGKRGVVGRSHRDECRGVPSQLFCVGCDLVMACH